MDTTAVVRRLDRVPPASYFVGSAVFHYLGPAFAVLLFALVPPLGVAWLRIAAAAAAVADVCRARRAMARMPRATYALLVSLLPATATVIGVVVLRQIPTPAEIVGVALVVAGVGVHRDHSEAAR